MSRRILGTSRVSPMFRVTLVKRARDILGIDVGDLVVFFEENGKIVIEKG